MSKASENLRTHQKQLDADGIMVGVSRQAVDETLAQYNLMQSALEKIVEHERGQWAMSPYQIARAALKE